MTPLTLGDVAEVLAPSHRKVASVEIDEDVYQVTFQDIPRVGYISPALSQVCPPERVRSKLKAGDIVFSRFEPFELTGLCPSPLSGNWIAAGGFMIVRVQTGSQWSPELTTMFLSSNVARNWLVSHLPPAARFQRTVSKKLLSALPLPQLTPGLAEEVSAAFRMGRDLNADLVSIHAKVDELLSSNDEFWAKIE